MKQRRLARVQVFRQPLVEDTPPETNNFPAGIDDGKHHARKKLLVKLPGIALSHEPQTKGIVD